MYARHISVLKTLIALIMALVCLLTGAAIVSQSENRTATAYDILFQGGTLTKDTTLSANDSPYIIIQDIIVPTGITLTIEPSTTLEFQADRSIQIKGGRLFAEGTITQSITFTKYGDGYWGGILLENTQQDNRLRYAVVEYTKEAITYPRTHGITAYSSKVTIADSIIRHTQVSGAVTAAWSSTLYLLRTEIYDIQGDAVHPTGGYAFIQGNHIHDIRNGIYPLEGIELSNMTTPAVVTDNHVHDVSDDCLDMNYSSAIIERNKFHHCGDKGISIGHYPSITTIVNNLIYECEGKDEDPYSGTGIAVKDGAISHIVNNTVSGCRHGIYLYQGHQGQGGGSAAIINTIVWGNESGIDMDSLSTVTVAHSDIEMDVGIWPGEGNINADPFFRAPQSDDFELQQESPCVDAGTETDAPSEDVQSICRPYGMGYDMGAYELQDNLFGGTLAKDTTFSAICHPTYVITDDVVVPTGITLTVEPGVTLRFREDHSLIVEGRLEAEGTSSQPVGFTRDGDDPWGAIILQNSDADNVIAHALVENADAGGTLIVTPLLDSGVHAYSSTLRVEHSTIRYVGGPALFAQNSTMQVLDNVIHSVMTDGVRIVGGDAAIFDNHIHDTSGDCLNLKHSSAIIERNELHHCGDTGISIGQPSSTTLVNNLVYANTDGIEIRDGAISRIVNNTVADNEQIGVWLRKDDLGENDSSALVLNSILMGNETDLKVDAHSTITVTYSNLYTYTATGTAIWPGEGNINTDPLFRVPQNGNYRLLQDSPCVDTGTPANAPDEDIRGIYRPHGDRHDMGAHEFFEYFDCYLPVIMRLHQSTTIPGY
ncbi:MAG: right-handed parallel beta-helix repeat-containing protein [Chloroflexi bacterium]|nr:right-handed parallel beta-helix repeat-containing protein [Chloroflexota bacterium]